MEITKTGKQRIFWQFMKAVTITSTWARGNPRTSGAGCRENGTSRSNREVRDLIVPIDSTKTRKIWHTASNANFYSVAPCCVSVLESLPDAQSSKVGKVDKSEPAVSMRKSPLQCRYEDMRWHRLKGGFQFRGASMMTLQEIINSINDLSIEERDYLFEFLRKKKEEFKGDNFWEGLQKFRKVIQSEEILFTDEDFADLRDKSVGREIDL
jgi:hypothetical protein